MLTSQMLTSEDISDGNMPPTTTPIQIKTYQQKITSIDEITPQMTTPPKRITSAEVI
jgi:hypothetical protein